jgi:steroid 5-alpha reductase family enzyme
MSFPTSAFLASLPWIAGAELVVLVVTFAVAKVAGKHSVIDSAWGVLFAAMAVAAFVRSSGYGDDVRRWLLLALPVTWGLRLAVHIGRRTVGKPEDPRYERLLAKGGRHPDLYAVLVVYLLQGVIAFVVAAPVLVGMFARDGVLPLVWVGVALWCVGVLFETVGDLQLERFRQDPANRGAVMDRGLWRLTRHPNYFGDACVWWAIFLVSASAWPGVLSLAGPVVMTLFLTVGSGVRIMERHMAGRPGWDEYAARTSMFVPRPPKRSARHRRTR